MTRLRASGALFLVSVVVALVLGLMPLPGWLTPFKPFWLALVLSYWLLEDPARVGLGVAFLAGVAADLIFGTLIGEHALRLVVLAFIIQRFRARLRFFPIWQQSLAVGGLLVNDRIVASAIRVFLGDGVPPLTFWLSPLSGLLIWPWLFLVLDIARMRGRQNP
jgi:rod shape-determining protein MreD